MRELAQRIVTLSENVHSEQVSRLRAIHVLSETIIDALDSSDTLHAPSSLIGPDLSPETVTHRLIPDPPLPGEGRDTKEAPIELVDVHDPERGLVAFLKSQEHRDPEAGRS